MNKSAFALVFGLVLVGLTAWAGPSLWRAHHQGGSSCCGLLETGSTGSCCLATAPVDEEGEGCCEEGGCCPGTSAIKAKSDCCGSEKACCMMGLPCCQEGSNFVVITEGFQVKSDCCAPEKPCCKAGAPCCETPSTSAKPARK